MRRLLSILTFLLLLPFSSLAQWSFDVPSIEAYIADHKDQRSLLLARSALEQGNVLLHQYSSDANAEYKAINVELDKYTRAFDVIDLMYQTLRTSLNTYDTYETFKQRIEDYKVMLTAYRDKCLRTGTCWSVSPRTGRRFTAPSATWCSTPPGPPPAGPRT